MYDKNMYFHTVKIDPARMVARIDRVWQNGQTQLFTEIGLTNLAATDFVVHFERCAKQLGEDILIDSPLARRILEI